MAPRETGSACSCFAVPGGTSAAVETSPRWGPPLDNSLWMGGTPLQALNTVFGGLSLALAQCDCVTVSVLQGTVMGGGVGLACATDLSISDTHVKFSLPETRLGLVPAQIAPFLVARIGGARTLALATAGASLGGADALRIGLIHQLCEPEELEAVIEKALERIKRGAPGAIAATKQLLRTLSPQGPTGSDPDRLQDIRPSSPQSRGHRGHHPPSCKNASLHGRRIHRESEHPSCRQPRRDRGTHPANRPGHGAGHCGRLLGCGRGRALAGPGGPGPSHRGAAQRHSPICAEKRCFRQPRTVAPLAFTQDTVS